MLMSEPTEIRTLRKRADLTQEEAANLLEIPVRTFRAYDRGERTPPYDKMDRIRRVLGEQKTDNGDMGNMPTKTKIDDPVTNGYVDLPLLSISAGASGESNLWEMQVDRYMTVRKETLQTESGADPTRMAVLTVTGDSMQGTLDPGDKVLILRQEDPTIVEGVVYVWRSAHRGVIVKRAHWVDDETLELISDNDKYTPIRITRDREASWECMGRVVRVMQAV